VLTLVDGSRYVVRETVSEIVDKVRAFRASVVLLAGRLDEPAARTASTCPWTPTPTRRPDADPVLDPQGYQRELLALLGTSDPLEVMEATLAAFRQRTAGLAAEAVERRPAPREWSVAELLGHLWDAEIAYAFRARAILAQDGPALIGYDQDAWATLARPPFTELLDAFEALRAANLALAAGGTPEERWSRQGVHEERGPTSFRLLTETIAGHDRAHLLQLDQTIAAVAQYQ
jgi:hypothetical protein